MTAVEQQREAVEAWFLMTAISCAFEPGRDYDFHATQLAWDAWLEATRRKMGISRE